MSYVHKKIRVFRDAGDVEVHRKRSDGRMKTYTSATDARAWCDITEDRRQHILDLVRQGDGKGLSLGKYIPIEAIIDILLANKNRDIKRLQEENDELKKLLKQHGIHYEEKPISVIEPQGHWVSEDEEKGEPGMAGMGSHLTGVAGSGETESEMGGPRSASVDQTESGMGGPGAAGVDQTESGMGGPGGAGVGQVGSGMGGPGGAEVDQTESGMGGPGSASERGSRVSGAKGGEEIGAGREGARGSMGKKGSATIDDKESRVSFRVPYGEDGKLPGEEEELSEFDFKAAEDDGTPFYTDSTEPDTSPRYGTDDEFLAGKTPEEQVEALKQALADSEALYHAEHELAARAIEQLENIKDIVEGGDGDRYPSGTTGQQNLYNKGPATATGTGYNDGSPDSCKKEIEALEREIAYLKSASPPEFQIIQREVELLKKYCAQLAAMQKENADLKTERDMLKGGLVSSADDALKDKLLKLEEVTQERDRLRARVQQLEQELLGHSNLPDQIDSFKGKMVDLDALREDENHLRERLDHLRGLEDEVRKLRDKSTATVQPGGDTKDRDELLAKIRELEREIDRCKCNMKELEILRVERNCLKMRVDDLCRVQQDYEDLLKKTQGFDALKAECAMYKNKYEELKNLEAECNELRAKVERVEELENERKILMKEIEDCECCMNTQEDEIKRLTCHIDCLTDDLDKRQDEMKTKVLTMRAHIEKKEILIANSEQKLADVQDELRSSIEELSCETTCLRNRIDELEDEVVTFQKALAIKDEDYKSLERNLRAVEDSKRNLEENNKALLDSLQTEKNKSIQLEEALRKAIKSDDHLQQMLKQAKCAIKCITQKLEKHEFVGVGRLEAEREGYLKKIKELSEGMTDQPCGDSDKITELEEELMRANALNKTLKDQLEQMNSLSQENDALRKLAAELQQTAKDQVVKLEDTTEVLSRKSVQYEDKCEELRKELLEKKQLINDLQSQLSNLKQQLEDEKNRNSQTENNLQQQLEAEKKRNADLIAGLENLSTNGELSAAEMNKLKAQINVLNAEIDRLQFDLDNQKRECNETVARLRAQIEQQEADGDRMRKLQDDNMSVSTDVDRYKKECELLKEELANRKKECDEIVANLKAKIEQQEADAERIRKLQDENADVSTDVDKYKKEGDVLREELEKLRNQLANSNSENDKLKNELEKMNASETEKNALKDNIEKERGEMKNEIDKLKQDKDDVDKENKNLKDELNRLKRDMSAKDDLENENKNLKDELNRLKKDTSGADNLQKENKNLNDEINRLKQDLASKDAKEKECDALKDELNKAKQDLAGKGDMEAENKSLKDKISNLEKELDALKKDASKSNTLENENKNLADEINRLKKELDKPADDSKDKDFVKERDDLLNQIDAQKKEIADLLNKIKEPTKSDDTTALKELENRNKENQQLRDNIDSLEKQLKDLQKAQLDVPKASPEIEKVVNDLKNSLEKEEARTRELEESLKKCQDNNNDLNKKNSELEESLRKCNQTNEDLKNKIAQLESETPTTKEIVTPGDSDKKVKELEAELAKRKKECNDMIASLKEQYDRDIKNLQKQNEAAINKLQKAQQDALKKLNQQHENEMDKLKQELRKRERSLSKLKESQKAPAKTEKPPPAKKEPVEQKVEKEPSVKEPSVKEPSVKEPSVKEPSEKELSMKTFEDVCICDKLPMVIPIGQTPEEQEKEKPKPKKTYVPQRPAQPQQIRHMPPCAARRYAPPAVIMPQPVEVTQPITYPEPTEEKITSIKKIVELENRLLVKQEQTKQKISMLQSSVERCKRELELEKQRNTDLVSRYTNQSKTVANMRVEMDIVKRESSQDKRKLQQLNLTLQNLLGGVANVRASQHQDTSILTVQPVVPHFHTELTLVKEGGNVYKHNCVMKRKSCSCNMGDISSDSFEIDE